MYRIKRKAVLIRHDIASGEQTGESSKKARETLGGGEGRSYADVADVRCQPASFRLRQNAEVVTSDAQHMPPTRNATAHGVDSKVKEEFQKVGLGGLRCITICDHLGIQNYDDLQWVNMQMVSDHKPVEREKFKALLSSFQRCKDSGVFGGSDSGGCEEVSRAPKKGSQLAVGGGAGVPSSGTRKQSGGGAAELRPAVRMNLAKSVKRCHACGSDGYSMRLDDAVQFLLWKKGKGFRETYKESFSHLAKSRLTTHQINTLPYDDIRKEVEKEIAAFILRLCKEEVIALREQGHDVSCLFECRKCVQSGTGRYMCDRARRGKDGEYFSQRENGFKREINTRSKFWFFVRKLNTKAGFQNTAI
jgi:hypothetical protein